MIRNSITSFNIEFLFFIEFNQFFVVRKKILKKLEKNLAEMNENKLSKKKEYSPEQRV